MGACHAVALLVAARALSAASASSCWATKEAECLAIAGCRWYAYRPEGKCELCDSVYPDTRVITGCRDWTPFYFCRRIYREALEKWHKDPSDHDFQKAVKYYGVSQGSGEAGNPHNKHWRCSVWCDPADPGDCDGLPRAAQELRGVNYGGRFVPEKYLGLPETATLFYGVQKPKTVLGKHVGSVSLCDVGYQAADATERLALFLDANIRLEHFSRIATLGFNLVRLPLGYWNLIDLPGDTTPNGPTPERWRGLQDIMPVSAYRKWIDMVFDYARVNGLRVLLDLHGAPGGQTGNAFTGCDTGKGQCHFDTPWNKKLAVRTVEKMAELCKAHGDTCYGIELLNEPAFGRLNLRPFLKEYYEEAIKAARRHLDKDTPMVIMDWTRMLPWWKMQKPFSYTEYGRVVFSTHLYDGFGVHNQSAARSAFVPDLDEIEDFSFSSKYEVIVSEYSLSGHGSGDPKDDAFDYHSLADWLVHQISQRSLGSVIWNYDAAGAARTWGAVARCTLGSQPIRWKDIFYVTRPAPSQDAEAKGHRTEATKVAVQVLAERRPGDDALHGLLALLPRSAAVGLALLVALAAVSAMLASLAVGRSWARTAPWRRLVRDIDKELRRPRLGQPHAMGVRGDQEVSRELVFKGGAYAQMGTEDQAGMPTL